MARTKQTVPIVRRKIDTPPKSQQKAMGKKKNESKSLNKPANTSKSVGGVPKQRMIGKRTMVTDNPKQMRTAKPSTVKASTSSPSRKGVGQNSLTNAIALFNKTSSVTPVSASTESRTTPGNTLGGQSTNIPTSTSVSRNLPTILSSTTAKSDKSNKNSRFIYALTAEERGIMKKYGHKVGSRRTHKTCKDHKEALSEYNKGKPLSEKKDVGKRAKVLCSGRKKWGFYGYRRHFKKKSSSKVYLVKHKGRP